MHDLVHMTMVILIALHTTSFHYCSSLGKSHNPRLHGEDSLRPPTF